MANLVTGKIIAKGPIKSTNRLDRAFDITYLAEDGESRPTDLDPKAGFIHALPMAVTVDMETLNLDESKYVLVTSTKFKDNAGFSFPGWVELPRFQPDEPLPPVPPATGKQYKVELTITGTISEIMG